MPQDQRVTELEGAVSRAVARLGLTEQRVLVGVSGGADSVSLLVALVRLQVRVEAACVNHGLRPGAAAEVELVRAHCARLGVPFHALSVVLQGSAGLEAAAREARYAALERLRAARGCDFIATGHTASDQAETVLMRLGRGTALGGAAGILERRGDGVVRPLLGVSRLQTHAYVEALGLEVAHDPMNDDVAFTRVRVRRDVLPTLVAALGAGTERALSRFAQLAAEDDAVLSAQAATALSRTVLPDGALDRVALLSLERPIARRVLAAFLELSAVPLDAELIADGLAAIERRATATLPLDLLLVVDGGAVRVQGAPGRTHSFGLVHRTSP
jgi:tRNA(Ile)-lysidine synthase